MAKHEIVIVPVGTWFAYLLLRYILIGALISIFSFEIIVIALFISFSILALLAILAFIYVSDKNEWSGTATAWGSGFIALSILLLFFYTKHKVREEYDKNQKSSVQTSQLISSKQPVQQLT